MLIELGDTATVVWSVVAWTVFGTVSGYLVTLVPSARLDHDTWLTRLRPWEDRGRWYDRRLGVRRWKDRLPELGALFPGGRSKRHLGGRDGDALTAFMVETRRAELVHWCNLAVGPVFLLWCRPLIGAAMVVFGVAAHSPFIVVQRFNRGRAAEILERRSRRRSA